MSDQMTKKSFFWLVEQNKLDTIWEYACAIASARNRIKLSKTEEVRFSVDTIRDIIVIL